MNTLNNDELSLIKEVNSNQIINSTLDIKNNSVLFINHESKEKLEFEFGYVKIVDNGVKVHIKGKSLPISCK